MPKNINVLSAITRWTKFDRSTSFSEKANLDFFLCCFLLPSDTGLPFEYCTESSVCDKLCGETTMTVYTYVNTYPV